MQQAAILGMLAVMKDYGGRMQNQEMAKLLNMTPSGLTNVLRGAMTDDGLVTKAARFYEVTEKGLEQLRQFVDHVLAAPE